MVQVLSAKQANQAGKAGSQQTGIAIDRRFGRLLGHGGIRLVRLI